MTTTGAQSVRAPIDWALQDHRSAAGRFQDLVPTARKPLRTGDVVRYGKAKAQVRQPIAQNFPHPSTAKFVVEQYVVVEIVDTTTGLAASLYRLRRTGTLPL